MSPPNLAWLILTLILISLALNKIPYVIISVLGLLLMGIFSLADLEVLFSGFGHPALITIIAVFILSKSIVSSGILLGLGQLIAKYLKNEQGQILGLAAMAAALSAFMNNVGAVGLLLPTAVRMADRREVVRGRFGLPLALASILGGSLTLIGSAPNVIVASFYFAHSGQSLRMFDFAYHGLILIFVSLIIWFLMTKYNWIPEVENSQAKEAVIIDNTHYQLRPFATTQRKITLLIIGGTIVIVSFGLIHPALGFSISALLLVMGGILSLEQALSSIDLKVVVFLGAMLSIGKVLEVSGALALLSENIKPLTLQLSPFQLLLIIIYLTLFLSNAVNNSAAAVFMSPIAFELTQNNPLTAVAALMAVACGANMTLLLPTHQATLMIQSKAPFNTYNFLKVGILISIIAGILAAATIYYFWQIKF